MALSRARARERAILEHPSHTFGQSRAIACLFCCCVFYFSGSSKLKHLSLKDPTCSNILGPRACKHMFFCFSFFGEGGCACEIACEIACELFCYGTFLLNRGNPLVTPSFESLFGGRPQHACFGAPLTHFWPKRSYRVMFLQVFQVPLC